MRPTKLSLCYRNGSRKNRNFKKKRYVFGIDSFPVDWRKEKNIYFSFRLISIEKKEAFSYYLWKNKKNKRKFDSFLFHSLPPTPQALLRETRLKAEKLLVVRQIQSFSFLLNFLSFFLRHSFLFFFFSFLSLSLLFYFCSMILLTPYLIFCNCLKIRKPLWFVKTKRIILQKR